MDPATIQAARSGNREACAALLRSLQDPWYRIALSMTGSDALAAEATQEAAMRLLRGIRQFRGDSQFRTWAIGILINVVREDKRTRRRNVSPVAPDPSTAEAADGIAERAEQHRQLQDLLANLPERQREALVLRFFEDLSVDQAAEAMKCAPGTVKATVHQALRALRRRLSGTTARPS